MVKYESEWYADENLSKWAEIDKLYQNEYESQKKELLDIVGPTNADAFPNKYLFKYLEHQFNQIMDKWKIEKEQRIKPSLWWSDVVTAQQAQTDSTTEPVLSKLPADGKAWFLHPVGMKGFLIQPYINDEGYIEEADIIFDKIPRIERNGLNKFNAIILHRTALVEVEKVLNLYKTSGVVGTHFIIAKNGDIYQCASLFKYTNHIGKIRMRAIYEMRATQKEWKLYYGKTGVANHETEILKKYPERFPLNHESIGIEVVAAHVNNKWETVTQEQLSAVARLVPMLQRLFQLTDSDLYQHQHISSKQPFEGWGLYPPSDVGVNAYPIIDKSGIKMTEENKYYLARYKKEKGY